MKTILTAIFVFLPLVGCQTTGAIRTSVDNSITAPGQKCDEYWDRRVNAIRQGNQNEADRSTDLYRICVDGGRVVQSSRPSPGQKCDEYWDRRVNAIRQGNQDEADRSTDLYRICVDGGRVVQSSKPSSNQGAGDGAVPLGNLLFLGLICSATPDPASCIAGAANSINGEDASTRNNRKLKEAEERLEQIEAQRRNECIFSGGTYSSAGCMRLRR